VSANGQSPPPELGQARARFLELVGEIRPEQIRDFRYVPYIADEVLHGRAAFRADPSQEQEEESAGPA